MCALDDPWFRSRPQGRRSAQAYPRRPAPRRLRDDVSRRPAPPRVTLRIILNAPPSYDPAPRVSIGARTARPLLRRSEPARFDGATGAHRRSRRFPAKHTDPVQDGRRACFRAGWDELGIRQPRVGGGDLSGDRDRDLPRRRLLLRCNGSSRTAALPSRCWRRLADVPCRATSLPSPGFTADGARAGDPAGRRPGGRRCRGGRPGRLSGRPRCSRGRSRGSCAAAGRGCVRRRGRPWPSARRPSGRRRWRAWHR